MKKKHLFIIAVVIAFLVGFYVVYKMYNKPHQNIAELSSDFQLSADEMINEFSANENLASTKYFDKIITVNGTLKQIKEAESQLKSIVISGETAIVSCELSNPGTIKVNAQNIGEAISVKGLFVGYDDLLGEIQLKKCTIISLDSNH